MKKSLILVGVLSIFLVGCKKETTDTTNNYLLTEGLKDCKISKLSDGVNIINVVRCPNSATTVTSKSGKSTIETSTIDGVNMAENVIVVDGIKYQKTENTKKIIVNGVEYQQIN